MHKHIPDSSFAIDNSSSLVNRQFTPFISRFLLDDNTTQYNWVKPKKKLWFLFTLDKCTFGHIEIQNWSDNFSVDFEFRNSFSIHCFSISTAHAHNAQWHHRIFFSLLPKNAHIFVYVYVYHALCPRVSDQRPIPHLSLSLSHIADLQNKPLNLVIIFPLSDIMCDIRIDKFAPALQPKCSVPKSKKTLNKIFSISRNENKHLHIQATVVTLFILLSLSFGCSMRTILMCTTTIIQFTGTPVACTVWIERIVLCHLLVQHFSSGRSFDYLCAFLTFARDDFQSVYLACLFTNQISHLSHEKIKMIRIIFCIIHLSPRSAAAWHSHTLECSFYCCCLFHYFS